MIAIKKKYSARTKSVLIPKVKIFTGETRELLDESILLKAIVKIPRDIRRLRVTEGNIKKALRAKLFSIYRLKNLIVPHWSHQFIAEKYFVKNQNEFLELFSLYFVALLAPRTKIA